MNENVLVKQVKLPVLRKIFRRGSNYVCGICRTEYQNKTEANSCLNHCWYGVKEQYPLTPRRDALYGKLFRCQYCCRDYKTEDAGLECAELCAEKQEKKHVQEQLTNNLEIEVEPRHKVNLVRVLPQTQMMPHRFKKKTQPIVEPIQEAENHDEKNVVVEEVVHKRGRHKSSFKKPWIRDGAKYKCMVCLELYYTKLEVEKCFKDHFDDDGYELN